jgi:hypothetical protein
LIERALLYGLTATSATTMGAAVLFAMIPDNPQAANAAVFMLLSSLSFGGLAMWTWIRMNEED